MARICYVILAHNEPINLLGVVGSLWNREDAFSIWLDAKADEDVVQVANALTCLGDNVKACRGRVMSWGGFSVLDTTLMAYSNLRDQFGDFSHVVLCSGTHIPLLHPDGIYEKIRDISGWVHFSQFEIPQGGLGEVDNLPAGWSRNALIRIRYRYAEVPSVGMLPVENRQNWIGPNFLKGSQWHILGSRLFDFIVKHQPEIRENFRNVQQPEEAAFQWIMSQAPQVDQLRRGDHVAMHWEGASPRRLSFPEAREVAEKGRFLFARKAQSACSIQDWISWAHNGVLNGDGSKWLRGASETLRSAALEPRAADRTDQSEKICNGLLGPLEAQLSAAFGPSLKLERRSKWRYLIDTGKRHSLGGDVFFLCFVEPSLGVLIVPALKVADLADDNPMRLRHLRRFFPEFVNLPVQGRVGWSIRLTNNLSDCKELINSVLREVQ